VNLSIVRRPPYEPFPLGDQTAMIVGRSADGAALFVRKWKGEETAPGNAPLMQASNSLAPTVRQLRQRQGRIHDSHASRGIVDLHGKHRGKTCVIVGCGPSMESALPAVRELHDQHDHVVIATNSSLKSGYGFCDYYMLLCWLSQHWWWEKADTSKIKLVTSFHTPPEVIRDFPERYYFDDTYLDSTVERPDSRHKFGCLDAGLTVTYSAMHLAFKMGCRRVVFVGLDLAYTGMMDHANDPLSWEKAKARSTLLRRDINGNTALTDEVMWEQRNLIRGQCCFLEEDGIVCVNATGAGILDLGTCMTPNEYLELVRNGSPIAYQENAHGDSRRHQASPVHC